MKVIEVLREEVREGQEACSQVISSTSAAANSCDEAAGAQEVNASCAMEVDDDIFNIYKEMMYQHQVPGEMDFLNINNSSH
jgi:hypothetical protein